MLNILNWWSVLGFLGIPALYAIYLLRSRFTQKKVSSLFLWKEVSDSLEGGLKIDAFQASRLFFLELGAIIFLTIAAMGPFLLLPQTGQELIIILDDSFSMLAGGMDSPRERAMKIARYEVGRRYGFPVSIVAASEKPELLGKSCSSISEAETAFEQWRCLSTESRIEEAISFAVDLGHKNSEIIVLTDHPPVNPPALPNLSWKALGKPLSNFSIINATRNSLEQKDRILLELANLSAEKGQTKLLIKAGSVSVPAGFPANSDKSWDGEVLQDSSLDFLPGEVKRVSFETRATGSLILAGISPDQLEIDNIAFLAPLPNKPVSVKFKLADAALESCFREAVLATQKAVIATGSCDLLFVDGPENSEANTWVVEVLADSNSEAFIGPFIIDRSHPLSEGLSMEGVIWGAGKNKLSMEKPVVLAGDFPLVSEVDQLSGKRIRIHLSMDLSTLPNSPDWPILLMNLINWREEYLPGIYPANVRLGNSALARFREKPKMAVLSDSNGRQKKFAVQGNSLMFFPPAVGVSELKAGAETFRFAANALFKDESDLRKAASGEWKGAAQAPVVTNRTTHLGWFFLLSALLMLLVHYLIIAVLLERRPA